MDNSFALGYGMSTAAGIRPFVTLAWAAIMVHQRQFHPAAQFAWLGNDGTSTILFQLAVIEFVGDKIPIVDHLFHIVHFATKPIAAALVAGGTIHFQDQHSMDQALQICTIAIAAANALGIHFAAVTIRGVSTVFTVGTANPFISILEDIACVMAIIVAMLVPVVGVVASVLFSIALISLARRLIRMRKRRGAGVA